MHLPRDITAFLLRHMSLRPLSSTLCPKAHSQIPNRLQLTFLYVILFAETLIQPLGMMTAHHYKINKLIRHQGLRVDEDPMRHERRSCLPRFPNIYTTGNRCAHMKGARKIDIVWD
jgi:hypothetical protein